MVAGEITGQTRLTGNAEGVSRLLAVNLSGKRTFTGRTSGEHSTM